MGGEVEKIIVDEQRGVVRVETEESGELGRDVLFKRLITSGCGRGSLFIVPMTPKVKK